MDNNMKLSEKIQLLRKENGFSQENLAESCKVSRQSISKWEADIALPDINKLIILSKVFNVSVDVLIKDNLVIDGMKEVHTCGTDAIVAEDTGLYEGVLIKESIDDESILDAIFINKVEMWKTNGTPRYWTVIYFTASQNDFPNLVSKVMISDVNKGVNWFVDFKAGNMKYIVFRNRILKYTIGNLEEKKHVCEECRKMGIPDTQMQWSE
ncbi:MAG: helix-turn-helix transcriptional regulator [Herbinix sp.]|jgi:transcriptional regulator with XRE-family HTH domain|nr:helix-turn-helix transcriptional regulator [Herbinix sp.]